MKAKDIIINKEFIRKLDPCKDSWKVYLENFGDWEGTLLEWMHLDFCYEDLGNAEKVWLFTEIPELKELQKRFALDCAWRVLPIFEEKYSADKRVRECLEATEKFLKNEISLEELNAKRRSALGAAATYAAAYAAYAAVYAAYAVVYAASVSACVYAGVAYAAAVYAIAAADAERSWQVKRIIELLKGESE